MLALLQNELVLYAIIVGLVAAFIIGRFIGFKKFISFFTGSGERAQAAKAKAAKATTATTAKSAE